jgi:hypothetical protein
MEAGNALMVIKELLKELKLKKKRKKKKRLCGRAQY